MVSANKSVEVHFGTPQSIQLAVFLAVMADPHAVSRHNERRLVTIATLAELSPNAKLVGPA